MLCLRPFVKQASKGYWQDNVYIPAKYVSFPCGRCINCRIKKRREWTLRLMNEALYSENAYFITLTYDEEHLPINENSKPSVSKKDIQLFMKRLRKFDGNNKIRFFINSEYGPQTGRPHYHGILYNVTEKICKPSHKVGVAHQKRNEFGEIVWINSILTEIWQKGATEIGSLCRERASYCAKYFIDKKEVPSGAEANFNLMSRGNSKSFKKGLGLEYALAVKDQVRHYNKFTLTSDNGTQVAIPRYYRNKIYTEEERLERFKDYVFTHQQSDADLQAAAIIDQNADLIEQNIIKTKKFLSPKSKI